MRVLLASSASRGALASTRGAFAPQAGHAAGSSRWAMLRKASKPPQSRQA
jgi:hypothetical protein